MNFPLSLSLSVAVLCFHPNSHLLPFLSSFSVPSRLGLSFLSLLPFLTFSYFLRWQEVTEIKGRKRWKEAKLTPTHISRLALSFLSRSKSVSL